MSKVTSNDIKSYFETARLNGLMIVLSDKVSDDAMGCTRSYRKAG